MALTHTDKIQIVETISRYNNASDTRDVEAHLAAYTETGRIVGGMGATEGGKEGLREVLPSMFAMEGTAKRHLAANHTFDERGHDVVEVSYVLTVLEAETAPAVVATAWVTDTFHREGERWLVDQHSIAIDPSFQVPT